MKRYSLRSAAGWLLIGFYVAHAGEAASQDKTNGGEEAHSAPRPSLVVILTNDQSWVGSSLQIIPDHPRT